MIGNQSNWQFCCDWYKPEDIHRSINSRPVASFNRLNEEIPSDAKSMEFAVWLTEQYRLAMNKGMEIMEREIKRKSEAANDQ